MFGASASAEIAGTARLKHWLDKERRVVRNAFGEPSHPESQPDWSFALESIKNMTEHQYPITLQADTVANFRRDGFINDIARSLAITPARLMLEVRRTAADTRSVSDKTTYEQSFIQCMRLGRPNST